MATKRRLKKRYTILLILLIIVITILGWARYVSTTGLYIREYKVSSNNLPDGFNGYKIVHFTDLHYGRTVGHEELEFLVNEINVLKPDLIFFTGDLIDKDTSLTKSIKNDLINNLSKLKAKIGKYAISGNHDFKFKNYINIIKDSGFIDLNNNYDIIYSPSYEQIYIAGLESEFEGKPNINKIITPLEITETNPNIPPYKILLLHTPDTLTKIKSNTFDLVLAGHSHNGQIRLPFIGAIFTPIGSKKYYEPYYEINKTKLYISGGIGTSNINFRFFNRPSFNFYRLVSK